jgi:hypothetical protein
VLELSLDRKADGASRSHGHRLGVEVVSSTDPVESDADGALIAEEARRDLEGLVARSRDLRESMRSSVVNDEENDV